MLANILHVTIGVVVIAWFGFACYKHTLQSNSKTDSIKNGAICAACLGVISILIGVGVNTYTLNGWYYIGIITVTGALIVTATRAIHDLTSAASAGRCASPRPRSHRFTR